MKSKILYTSLIVAVSLFGAIEVKGQYIGYDELKNTNMFQSQDTTANAKAYNKLKTRVQRDSIIAVRIAEDWVSTILGRPEWNCNQATLQLVVNSHDWGDTIYDSTGKLYNGNYEQETNIQKLFENKGTLKDMGKLGLPIYNLVLSDKTTLPGGHGQSIILTGDDATKLEDWTIIEPQYDSINIKPGDGRSVAFPKNCEIVQIYYNYIYNYNGTKRYNSFLMLQFKVKEGVAELTYNVNKDTSRHPWLDFKPLNEIVHLIEKRSDISTATKPERRLENELKVYPNPTRNYINIETVVNAPTAVKIELYDISGRRIEQKTTNMNGQFKEQLDISNVAPGMYMLHIKINNNGKIYSETTRIVKHKE